MGPVVTKEAKERILGLINKGVEQGADLASRPRFQAAGL